jgi:hypothetical protein
VEGKRHVADITGRMYISIFRIVKLVFSILGKAVRVRTVASQRVDRNAWMKNYRGGAFSRHHIKGVPKLKLRLLSSARVLLII